jgi:eukaryotic-like serine/threonine-protein kinase
MRLSAGEKLGPYEILASAGAGGMGEVYKARDTRLDRTVAIKVLPPHTAENPEARQRFEREARAVSSLNHPHICTLYDVGQQDSTDFLVMEYLEGESLAARLARGPLPVEQALWYGIEIADALAQVHRQGVFHRDLKPGNIMLTKGGAKLLDFGLAKRAYPRPSAGDEPTVSADLTKEGTLLGTVPYMAPEQLQGRECDARTDIFAFGAVLYEMVSGRRPFAGETVANLVAAILEHEPPPLLESCSRELDRVVRRCLAKDPEQRCQSAWDLKAELQWTCEAGTLAGITTPAAPRHKTRERLAWVLGIAGVLATLLMGIVLTRSAPAPPLLKLSILPPEKLASDYTAAISPDGRLLTLAEAQGGKNNLLWVRPLDSFAAQGIPGTEGAYFPFWSPDSRFIGFFARGKLKKIEVGISSGYGSPQTLGDAPDGRGGAWNRDGVIVFSPNLEEGLYRVSAAGGPVTAVTALDRSRQETSHRWPYFLPDGRHFLYWVRSSGEDGQGIYVGALDAGLNSQLKKRLLSTATNAAYAAAPAASGYLLFEQERMLMAQPFHPDQLQLTGEAVRLANEIRLDGNNHVGFSASATGLLAYRGGDSVTQLVRFDRTGKRLESIPRSEGGATPRLSPDGKLVAFMRLDLQSQAGDIWLLELSRGISSRLTSDPAYDWRPVWSPDGSRMVFASNRRGPMNLYQRLVAGGRDELLLASNNPLIPTDWSSDGRFVIYEQREPKTRLDLWVLPVEGDRKPFPFLQTEFDESEGRLSPDGRWMAYTSNESGTEEVYVQRFGGVAGTLASTAAGKSRISTNGGSNPTWRRDGKELLYIARDLKLMAVEVKGSSTFEPGIPKELFKTRAGNPGYAVTPDGQHFLVPVIAEDAASPFTLFVNWTTGLKR